MDHRSSKGTVSAALLVFGLAGVPALAGPAASEAAASHVATARTRPAEARAALPTPLDPLLAPPYKGETVEIETADKLTLAGSWFAPRRKSQPVPGVVLIHDAGGNRKQLEAIAERLQKDGFAALTIDLRGHGGSISEKLDWTELDDQEEKKALWAFAQRDVDAAVGWLLARQEVHSTRLALIGYGAGCALAVRHMRDDDNAVAIALIEPSPKSYGYDLEKDLAEIEGLPTYVIGTRGGQEDATEKMVAEANSISTGNPYVQLWLTRPPVLEDRKTAVNLSKFLEAHAMPKRGGRGR